ncbi:threonine--tRNA ligase [Sulfobacillus thermosulfidooxidans]|uniref:threonine--tRNA ligase n=1 Tax=Sulfobacillus thermosulfidooxidans TaxID=28034 RepID=UPI00096BB9E0|nr:threonine--tRNA ligase [Sulfobacillus thermosulfidooxidans]OLZ10070.1 threonine--tRNA ligase [Sulfobacillus thermosulfidooxidans]OLZ16255.1 threonine--tRNA ligase [Sulfobacillus thermosulfidooxidans]OLZ18528.1 threonine--tRNA ligase [Sulfobacillus thermosulfidooxidans]
MNDLTVEIHGEVLVKAPGVRPLDFREEMPEHALAAWIDGDVVDLKRPLPHGGQLQWLTFEDSSGQRVFRHSSAHLLAQAVKRLWPEAKLGTGPALDDGFYYDIWLPNPLKEDDLQRIEEMMRTIVQENLDIERVELSREEALALFKDRHEDFKLEIIQRIPEGTTISAYRQGEFIDLCSGPHLPSTGLIQAIKLTNVSGAYWRGNENNPMMTRIYGTSFPSQAALQHYMERLEEVKQRDHRRLGPQLDLFSFREEAPGFAFWHPKGFQLYRTLEEFSRRLQSERGYEEVSTPWIYRVGLWQRSGHWDHYRDNMFLMEREDELLGAKPMNCPGHALLFKESIRSYRDLPIRYAEYGPLSRFERSGTLHGLLRVRGFHQDDAHLFVREDQINQEMFGVLDLVDIVFRAFGLPYEVVFSTRPDDYMGSLELWNKAEKDLEAVLHERGIKYQINPGDGAFYGPKLDISAIDSLGRHWQLATVQLDFQLPEKFDLTYVDQDGSEKRPVMIHRAIMGSVERFVGILVEHYGGAFPLWLAPVQVVVIPITDQQLNYAQEIAQKLKRQGLRVEVDVRNQKMNYKIREAQLRKIPRMLIVGGRDLENHTVSVRTREEGDIGAKPWPEYIDELVEQAQMPLG